MQNVRINIQNILQKNIHNGIKTRILHKLTKWLAKQLDFMTALLYHSKQFIYPGGIAVDRIQQ